MSQLSGISGLQMWMGCAVLSHSVVSDSVWPHGLSPARLLCPWGFSRQETGVGCHFLLQGIFPNQGSNLGLLHCRQTLYPLSHQGIPSKIFWLEVLMRRFTYWLKSIDFWNISHMFSLHASYRQKLFVMEEGTSCFTATWSLNWFHNEIHGFYWLGWPKVSICPELY